MARQRPPIRRSVTGTPARPEPSDSVAGRLKLMQDLMVEVGTASNLAGAMSAALRKITSTTGWEYGEGWLRTSSGGGSVRRGAAFTLTREACWPRMGARFAELRNAVAEVESNPSMGLPARFWHASRARWVGDLKDLSSSELSRRAEAQRAGVRAIALVPIFSDGRSAAVLLLFVCRSHPDDRKLIRLVSSAVAPLGHLVQRLRAEDELADHHAQLERIVEERTGQLERSRRQLLVADRMASLGTLAAGLGHDMNNVLLPVRAHLNALRAADAHEAADHAAGNGSMNGYASGNGNGSSNGNGSANGNGAVKRVKHMDAIEKSVDYLQQLADGLHFLALDPDKSDPRGDPKGTDLYQWWTQVGAVIAKGVARHIKLRTSISATLPPVAVPTHRLTQAILNLVVNASEAIPEDRPADTGIIRIRARQTKSAAGPHSIRLSVSDNGIGMSPEVLSRAQELFYTTKSRGLGAGIGLALVRKVVEGANGSLEVATAPGRGTTVTLVLPLAKRIRASADEPSLAPIATVSIRDGRAAALVRQILSASGIRTASVEGSTRADIRVVEPKSASLAGLQLWRAARPTGSLILFGPPAASEASAWMQLHPIVVQQPNDLHEIRSALAQAMEGSP